MILTPFALVADGPAGAEPVATSDLAAHLRIDSTGEYTLLTGLITAARELAEPRARRALVQQRYQLVLDDFPAGGDALELPRPPLVSVDAVEYVDGDGTVTTWDSTNYQADTLREPGRVMPTAGQSWPSVGDHQLNAARIHFTAGPTPDEVPQRIKQAIQMLAGHWYEYREDTAEVAPRSVPFAFDVLVGSAHTGDLL